MKDEKKTKEQLIKELMELRQRIAELETSKTEHKQVEEAIQKSEATFRTLTQTNAAAIVIFQGDKLRYVNPATETLTGYTKEELLKINFWDFIHPEFRELVKERWLARLRGEKVDQIVEFKITTKSGKMRWLSVSEGIIELEGEPTGIGTAFDITERKLVKEGLLESEKKYRDLADNAIVGIYQTNLKGDILYVNEALWRMLGFESSEEMMAESVITRYKNPKDREVLIGGLKKTGRISNFETELITKTGKTRNVILNATLEEDIISGMIMDVSDRKQAEEAIQESELKFRILAETNAAAIVIFQGDKFLYVNPATEALTGYSKEELLEKNFGDFIHPEFRQLIKEREFIRQQGEKVDPTNEFKIITKSGEPRWVSTTGGLIEFNGKPATIGTAFDITERRRVEKALRESEIKFRTISDNALIGIYKTNFKGDILYANEALVRMLEFDSIEELMVFGVYKTYKKSDDRKALIETLKKSGKVSNFETELLTKKEKVKKVILNAILDDNTISGMMLDISERKQVEEELLESEQRFRAIFENASDGILVVDIKTKKFYLSNKMIRQMLGYNQEEINTLTVMDIHPEKDLPHVLTQFEKQAKREIILAENLPVKRKDGSVFYADVNTFYITLAGKAYMAGIFRDITERKMSEEALRESEERYRTLFEESREAIYITTRDGKFVNANQSMLNLFGYTKDEMLILKALQIYVNPDERTRFQQDIEQTGFVKNYKVKFRKKNGTEMDCLLTSTLWNDINGTIFGYQGIIRDITELKKVEDQLRYISLHDSLTGLYNRAYFEEEMHRVESGRYDSAGIIMCDVDGLKLVNDALGHYTGDNLLRETANILKESFREGDVAARVGGDEFAVLLPNSDRNAIEIARLRIQDAIERYNSSNPPLPLSISIGSAIGTGSSIIMTNLFKEADNNMYREKLQNSLSARSTIVQTLMKALETRDFTANGHVSRLQKLSTDLAMSIGLQEQKITDLRLLAEFHDIGKVGISDHILFKTGPLTSEEIIEMQRHCEIGHRIALCTPDLIPIANLILKHHEWWDGKGYPLGIKGKEIPLECRILAIAETYEAMTSDRPYHKAISHEEAVAELRMSSGTKFAPDLVTKFIEVLDNIKE